MNFHITYGHAAKFVLAHKSESDFSELYLKLMELKRATPLDILRITVLPEVHSIEVLVEPAKALSYKAFFASLGFSTQSLRTVTTARPVLHGAKTVDEILPAITGISPEEVETE